jgi:hypothetical protein
MRSPVRSALLASLVFGLSPHAFALLTPSILLSSNILYFQTKIF